MRFIQLGEESFYNVDHIVRITANDAGETHVWLHGQDIPYLVG